MKKLIYLISILFFVISLTGHEAMARDTLTAKEKATIEKAVKRELLDPESARFKWFKLAQDVDMKAPEVYINYCVLVNSKNTYGGYVGDKPFMVAIGWNKGKFNQKVSPYSPSTEYPEIDWQMCAKEGYADPASAE